MSVRIREVTCQKALCTICLWQCVCDHRSIMMKATEVIITMCSDYKEVEIEYKSNVVDISKPKKIKIDEKICSHCGKVCDIHTLCNIGNKLSWTHKSSCKECHNPNCPKSTPRVR